MVKVRIIVPKSLERGMLTELHRAKILHISEPSRIDAKLFSRGSPFEEADYHAKLLVQMHAIMEFLNIQPKEEHTSKLKDVSKKAEQLIKIAEQLRKELQEAEAMVTSLRTKMENPLLNLKIKKELLGPYKSLETFVGSTEKDPEDELQRSLKSVKVIKAPYEGGIALAVFVPKEKATEAQQILNKYKFRQWHLPEENKEQLEKRIEKAMKKLRSVRLKVEKFKEKHEQEIKDVEDALAALVEKGMAPVYMRQSKRIAVLEGWIPENKFEEFKSMLAKKSAGKAYVEVIKSNEEPPTELRNIRTVEPFEAFINMFSIPKYYELDPTAIMGITFPLFFGFMLGDIGYGITSLVIALVAKRFFTGRTAKALLNVMIMASLATILFGFVYGEFFGTELFEHPIMNRVENINQILLITIIVGVIHVNLGLALGFINEMRKHGLQHAIFAKFSWVLVEAGVGAFILDMFGVIQLPNIVAGLLVLTGAAMLLKSEGIAGIIEMPTLFGHIMSYARLFGVGIASVMMAQIINHSVGELFAQGGFSIVLGIGLLVAGHVMNFLIGIIDSFIQSLRLHYVEFFGKFYEGGGKPYIPFGMRKEAT
jgi:V/A-type H+-transporting ATPase subunit I